jgi:hypothetical protein
MALVINCLHAKKRLELDAKKPPLRFFGGVGGRVLGCVSARGQKKYQGGGAW